MKYDHIVFDIDGTLIDTEYAVLHSLQETAADVTGENIGLGRLRFALGITGEDALKELSVEDIPAALRLWDKYMDRYRDTVSVFGGIPEILTSLSEMGCRLGIVTSKTREEFEHDFCRFGIEQYFGIVVCADDTAEHKPSPDPLLKYIALSGAGRNEVLYVGDSRYDSKCAGDAGVAFALAVWGSHCRAIRADYSLEKPEDLYVVQGLSADALSGERCDLHSHLEIF